MCSIFAEQILVEDPVGSAPILSRGELEQYFTTFLKSFESFGITSEFSFTCENEVVVHWSAAATMWERTKTFEGIDYFKFDDSSRACELRAFWDSQKLEQFFQKTMSSQQSLLQASSNVRQTNSSDQLKKGSMKLKFVTPNQHGVGDFLSAGGLIILPFLLSLGSAMTWFSVGFGIFLISYSLLTKYAFGLWRILPFPGHLAIDWFDAFAFAVAPTLLNLHGWDAFYSYLVSVGVVSIVVVTMPQQPQASLRGD